MPPLFGFFAKLLVLKAAIDAGFLWLAIVAIVFAIIGIYYYLRVVKVMYFDAPVAGVPAIEARSQGISAVLALNGGAVLVLGLLPGSDPQRDGEKWADRLVAGMLVPSVVAQAARLEDPYLKDARTKYRSGLRSAARAFWTCWPHQMA